MTSKSFRGLFVGELLLLYSTESLAKKTFLSLGKKVFSKELSDMVTEQASGASASAVSLKFMIGFLNHRGTGARKLVASALLAECTNATMQFKKGNLRDAAILACLRRFEAYRAVSYDSTLELARRLGEEKVLTFFENAVALNVVSGKHLAQIALQVDAEAFVDTHTEDLGPQIPELPRVD